MDDQTRDIYTYLTSSPGSHFLNSPVTILAQWEGASNLLWRVESGGQEAVVKYYLDAGQARGRRQFDGQERFSRFGIAPRPLWFDRYPTGLSRQVLAYQWVPGEPIAAADRSISGDQLVGLAHAVAQIHSGDPTVVRRFSPNPLNLDYLWRVLSGGVPQLQQWLVTQERADLGAVLTTLTERAAYLVEAALPLWQGVAPTPVHGDLKLEHAVDSFGAIVLLDWEQFGLGDAAYDAAYFLHMSQAVLGEDDQARWLDSYLASFAQTGLQERIAVYARILPLQNLTYLLHGLRQSTPDELVAIGDNRQFFQQTVLLSWQQTAASLQVPTPDDQVGASLQRLFDQLLDGRRM